MDPRPGGGGGAVRGGNPRGHGGGKSTHSIPKAVFLLRTFHKLGCSKTKPMHPCTFYLPLFSTAQGRGGGEARAASVASIGAVRGTARAGGRGNGERGRGSGERGRGERGRGEGGRGRGDGGRGRGDGGRGRGEGGIGGRGQGPARDVVGRGGGGPQQQQQQNDSGFVGSHPGIRVDGTYINRGNTWGLF